MANFVFKVPKLTLNDDGGGDFNSQRRRGVNDEIEILSSAGVGMGAASEAFASPVKKRKLARRSRSQSENRRFNSKRCLADVTRLNNVPAPPFISIGSPSNSSIPSTVSPSYYCDDNEDVFSYNNDYLSSSYKSRNQKLLPSFSGSSPLNLPSVNSPERKKLLNSGLDSFKNIKVLGKGSYGTVILGSLNGKRVAVKVIPQEILGKKRLLKSLESELNAELLSHDNIVRIHGVYSNSSFGNTDDNTIIVMEYVGKSNLQKILDENLQVLDHEFIHKCLFDISGALKYCHDKGVLHLDVKPSNIFVSSKGICKLGDFGCSHLSGYVNGENLVGTPGYQAPEFLTSLTPSEKCDVFSFSIVMWQLINKENPYNGLHPHTIVFKVVSENLRPKDDSILDSSYESYRLIYRKCWNQDPKRRPTMKEVYQEISQCNIKRKFSTNICVRV